MNEILLVSLIDRARIIELVNRFGMEIDLRQWQTLATLFFNPVEFDYSSIGGPAGNLQPEEIANTARHDLSGFQATQHIITNHQVEISDDSATCQAHVSARRSIVLSIIPYCKLLDSSLHCRAEATIGCKSRSCFLSHAKTQSV